MSTRVHLRPVIGRPGAGSSAAWLSTCALALLISAGLTEAQAATSYRGRPILEVLRELQHRGLDLIFSSAVVDDRMTVQLEPTASVPRAILDQILPPVGLRAEDGPDGTILILPQSAQGRLTGRVVATADRAPIRHATIRLSGNGPTLRSGPDGRFEIDEVPEGLHELHVEARGFIGANFAVDVRAETTDPLIVSLQEQPQYATKIIVTPGRHSIIRQEQAPRRTMEHEDTLTVPAIGGDVSRLVESLTGVVSGDNAASFHMRGSTTRDVSFILDGLELYDPFHLQSLQSPFSLIDTDMIDQLDVFQGGYTAELGDRHGGFVQMATLPTTSEPAGEIELGTLNSRTSYRSPGTPGRGPWLLSARAWYPSALFRTIEIGGEEQIKPLAGDFYAKSSLAVHERYALSAHALLGLDRVKFTEPGAVGQQVDVLARSGYAWLRLHGAWAPGWSSETLLSLGRIARSRDGIAVPDTEPIVVADHRSVDFVGLKHDSTWEVSQAQALKAGIEFRALRASYRYATTNPGAPPIALALDPHGISLGAYAAYRASIGRHLATEVGLRWDRQNYTEDNQVSPRFNALWRPGDRTEVRLAVGRFSQSQRIHELSVEDGEAQFHAAEAANQVDLTAQHELERGLRLRLDAYFQHLSRLRPRYENLFTPFELFPEAAEDRVIVAPRNARLRGVELLLQGRDDRPWLWWVGYARSSAKDRIDGRFVPRSWDQTHAGKFMIGYHRGALWWISLSGTAHTGWPTTPATGSLITPPGEPPEFELVPGERNTRRYPAYARLDFKTRRTVVLARGRLSLTLEVANLTNRKNACCVGDFQFEFQPNGTIDALPELDSWIGITPSATATWEF